MTNIVLWIGAFAVLWMLSTVLAVLAKPPAVRPHGTFVPQLLLCAIGSAFSVICIRSGYYALGGVFPGMILVYFLHFSCFWRREKKNLQDGLINPEKNGSSD